MTFTKWGVHMTYPVSTEEHKRIETLTELHILDTSAEPAFDTVTESLCDIFDIPISAISLVDKDRQWFKSITGLDVCETEREVAFCNYTIVAGCIFEVTSATEHPIFCENALVTGEPGIRYYCGTPILFQSQPIGALCLIDLKPRPPLSSTQRRILARFSSIVSRELMIRRVLKRSVATLSR